MFNKVKSVIAIVIFTITLTFVYIYLNSAGEEESEVLATDTSQEIGTVPTITNMSTVLPLQDRELPRSPVEINESVTINGEDIDNFMTSDTSSLPDEFIVSSTGKYLLNGLHTYTWSNGDSYTGEWVDGRMHGSGIYTWVDGVWYDSKFRRGKPITPVFEFEGRTFIIR